jgi:cytochrome b pre-mRNA-processing protein 3
MSAYVQLMALIDRLFGRRDDPRAALRPLYAAVIDRARAPVWYHEGAPDTLDGRFDMVSAVLAQVMLRLEQVPGLEAQGALLAEIFVEDMDGQLREIGIGDMMVGKHVGRMMAALGGRLGAYRDAGGDAEALAEALERNVWRGEGAPDGAAAALAARMLQWRAALADIPIAAISDGVLPPVPA